MAETAEGAVCGVADDAASVADEPPGRAWPPTGDEAAMSAGRMAGPAAAPMPVTSNAAWVDGAVVTPESSGTVGPVVTAPQSAMGAADAAEGDATPSPAPPDAAAGFGSLAPAGVTASSGGLIGQISPTGIAAIPACVPSSPEDVRVTDCRAGVATGLFAADACRFATPPADAEPSSPCRSASGVVVAAGFGSWRLDATARAESGGIVCVP